MNEYNVKEICKQIIDRRNDLNEIQKYIIKEAIEHSNNIEELICTAIVSNLYRQ